MDFGTNDRVAQISFGIFLTVTGLGLCIFTISVIVAFYRSKLIFKSGSPLFVLSTWSLVDSSLILLILGGYNGPIIWFQSYFFDPRGFGPFSYHIGQLLITVIIAGSLLQTIIAINRFLAVFYSHKKNFILSRSTYHCIAILIYPLSLILSYVPAYTLRCCKFYMNYVTYAPMYNTYLLVKNPDGSWYLDPTDNDVWTYINRPFFIINTLIPVFCYGSIFGYHMWLRRETTSGQNTQRIEVIRSIQFALIFSFYASTWIYYEIISNAEIQWVPAFALMTVFMLLEAAMNVILQATLNSTVRSLLLCRGIVSAWTCITSRESDFSSPLVCNMVNSIVTSGPLERSIKGEGMEKSYAI